MSPCSSPILTSPLQLPLLTNLHTLRLWFDKNERNSLGVLSTLGSLRSLNFTDARQLPACLPVLTQLEELEVYPEGALSAEDAATLGSTLEKLHQLTCLGLNSTSLANPPAGLTEMTRLQRLLLWNRNAAPGSASLPPGPWLGGLRWLGLAWPAACSSVTALAAACQLEHLVITGRPDRHADDAGPWDAFWNFVLSHQSLRCLSLHFSDGWPGSRALFDAVLRVARRRPTLLIQRTDTPFYNQMSLLEGIPE